MLVDRETLFLLFVFSIFGGSKSGVWVNDVIVRHEDLCFKFHRKTFRHSICQSAGRSQCDDVSLPTQVMTMSTWAFSLRTSSTALLFSNALMGCFYDRCFYFITTDDDDHLPCLWCNSQLNWSSLQWLPMWCSAKSTTGIGSTRFLLIVKRFGERLEWFPAESDQCHEQV